MTMKKQDAPSQACKTEFIVGVNADGTDKTVAAKMYGRKLHLIRCARGVHDGVGWKEGAVYVPDKYADENLWYEILAVSSDCRIFGPEHIGAKVLLPHKATGKTYNLQWGCPERVVRESLWDSKLPFIVR